MIHALKRTAGFFVIGLICSIVLLLPATAPGFKKGIQTAGHLRILNVSTDRLVLNPAAAESVTIRFKLTKAANVSLNIYDSRNYLIRSISDGKSYPAGDTQITWDGRDGSGAMVPDEAYVYTLTATSGNETVTSDLTDAYRGEMVWPRQVKFDAATGHISYVLLKPSRVRIRLGIKDGGPLLLTLADWQPRSAGLQREQWDGFDNARLVNFIGNPKVEAAVEAFALSTNTIIVKGNSSSSNTRFIQTASEQQILRTQKAPLSTIELSSHAAQSIEANRDPKVEMIFPTALQFNGMQANSQGAAIVIDRPTPIKLQLAPGEPNIQAAEPREVAYYLDFVFLEEVYVDQLPATWTLDPGKVSEGEHILTGAFYDRQGHVGTTMVKITVKHQK